MDTNQTTQNPEASKATQQSQTQWHCASKCGKNNWFSSFFWGLFVILIGVMFLAKSLGFVQNIDWRAFFGQIWPVFVIFFGLSIMSRGGIFAKIISSILMLLIMTFFFLWFFHIPLHFRAGNRQIIFDPVVMSNRAKNSNN